MLSNLTAFSEVFKCMKQKSSVELGLTVDIFTVSCHHTVLL